MATYHVTAVPKAGVTPDGPVPLGPRDITAGSDAEAQGLADGLMAQCIGERGEHHCDWEDEAAVAAFNAWAAQWQTQVRRVNRPVIDVNPRSWTTDTVHDGRVVGTRYHYGNETGEQSFDVVADGVVSGLIVESRLWLPMQTTDGQMREMRAWRLTTATGVLAGVVGRQWNEDWPVEGEGLVWPDAALAGIRAALEK
jgi:hypothetical protein